MGLKLDLPRLRSGSSSSRVGSRTHQTTSHTGHCRFRGFESIPLSHPPKPPNPANALSMLRLKYGATHNGKKTANTKHVVALGGGHEVDWWHCHREEVGQAAGVEGFKGPNEFSKAVALLITALKTKFQAPARDSIPSLGFRV